MKRNKYLLSLIALSVIGCSEIPMGYISDKIIYMQNPLVVEQGIEKASASPTVDGSSYPLHFSISEVTDLEGNPTTVLTDSVPTRVWSEPFDYLKDTSIEDVNKKLQEVMSPPMRISESGGQLFFSTASTNVPLGKYNVSIKMSNTAGERIYENAITIDMKESAPYWVLEGGEGAFSWNSEIGSWGPVETAGQYFIEHDPEGENVIELMICDKNGVPFNWKKKEIVNRGVDRGKLEDVCFGDYEYTDRSAIFKYPFAPFPFAPGGKEGYQYSYRILKGNMVYDDPSHSGYMNLVINFRALKDGKWTVKIVYPAITHV